jgi:hypothetical protein
MHLEVILIAETKNSTLSQLRVDGQFFCFVLEDGYREIKEYGNTRIPDGTYVLKPRTEGSFYKKYNEKWGHKFVIHVTDVPKFEYILMHIGNYIRDTKGCSLVGDSPKLMYDNFTVMDSAPAYMRLYAMIEPEFTAKRTVLITYKRDAGSVMPTVDTAAVTA